MGHRKFDMDVAEKVLGWERGRPWGNGNGGWTIDGKPYEEHRRSWEQTPRFSTDMGAAMQVVDALQGDPVTSMVTSMEKAVGKWWVQVYFDGGKTTPAVEESLPRAICLAALAAVGTQG